MKKLLFLSLLSIFFISNPANAQIDTVMRFCSKFVKAPFISDGQQYKALLSEDETAEFHITFYGGSTYRLSGASSGKGGKLIFSVYDKERNLLFSNKDHNFPYYWDFKFKCTMDCIVEAELDSKSTSSGLAILLIGFKQ